MLAVLAILISLASIACSCLTVHYSRQARRNWERIRVLRAETAAIRADRIARYGA